MTATFDVKDKKWQVSEDFPPDKESTWPTPMEKDGWMHAHNALRDQLRSFIEVLEVVKLRGTLDQWEIDCIRTVWHGHYLNIHDHHENEDRIYTPFLKTRFHYPEKCETDHDALVVSMDKLSVLVKALKVGDKADNLLSSYVELEKLMLPHLKQEEDECLPLCRAYFTQEECLPKIQEIIKNENDAGMGGFIHTMGEAEFRQGFMKQEGIPFFVWYIQFWWQYRAFKKQILQPMAALKAGKK